MNEKRVLREQEHFDKLARETGEIWWGSATPAGRLRKKRRAQLILSAAAAFEDPLLLELGCGTGALTRYLLEINPNLNLIGLDVSPLCIQEAIQRFQQNPRADFQVANAYELPIRSGAADVVAAASVLHHLDVNRALKECFRVLKPGGLVWFSEPNMMNPQVAVEKNIHFIGRLLDNSDDETAFFRWRLARRLRQAGFEQVRITPYDFLHPAVPERWIPFARTIERFLEAAPLLREISGSLIIQASKPVSAA
ncbi:MAG: methyltransferase domain-containing protein [Candidatus Omnitrophica bacterium]|nr:methyltransferase domain-containing protein [Candidatus Omnitrophota bacterium]